jgi:transposase-like protein
MSSEIPDLPPRKAPDVDTIINESKTLLGYPCYSPLALLVSLEASHSDHQHVFKSLFAANEQPTAVADAQENILVDTVDTGEPVIVPTNVQSRFICQLCHVSLLVNHTSNSLGCSGDSENLCHHFHLQKNNEYRCCECQYTLSTEIREPILPMALFSRLEATRAKARSFADLMQKKEETPTLVSTYSTVLIYISDLLKGIKRNINTQNPNFIARVGLGDGR